MCCCNIVLVSYGNGKLRAVAKIIGEYKFLNDDNLNNYQQSRAVEWLLVPDEPFSYEKILKKQFSQMSIYDIKNNVKINSLKELLTHNTEILKPYILIIDEINRGNISKIFGELITLIELSKRIGADEEIKVQLPYSNEEFGVPKNLYIIGTMNTADRSIALLDTALRRRFEFIEMIPQAKRLKKVEDIDLEKMLEIMNKRIEYLYDKDHTIGHSYFMEVKTLQELKEVFLKKIIPLLEEYFYDDYEKIKLVFNNNGFVKKDDSYKTLFSKFSNGYEEAKTIYKINKNSLDDVKNYIEIYE